MSTILVYDWDFFHYHNVIPNLECAKYAAWRKQKKDIVVFNNQLEPSMYTKTFFRKEYDDGIYDKKILYPTVEYGGRAFSQTYTPFDLGMERIEPDFSIYDKYRYMYGQRVKDKEEIRTILYATHVRLSLDGKTLEPFPFDRLRPRHPSVILHDYDISSIPNVLELLKEVSKSRPSGLPYRIGNKYPINIYNYDELKGWLQLAPMGSCFYLQYNGVFTDEEIIDLAEHPYLGTRQLIYNFTYNCTSESQFVIDVLPKIYRQTLFLQSNSKKILLNIDTDFFKTKELLDLMKLIDCFYGKSKYEYLQTYQKTLYRYCAWKKRAELEVLPWVHFRVSREEMRASFQYIRKHNYELFDNFYNLAGVTAEGGKLIDDRLGNSCEDK